MKQRWIHTSAAALALGAMVVLAGPAAAGGTPVTITGSGGTPGSAGSPGGSTGGRQVGGPGVVPWSLPSQCVTPGYVPVDSLGRTPAQTSSPAAPWACGPGGSATPPSPPTNPTQFISGTAATMPAGTMTTHPNAPFLLYQTVTTHVNATPVGAKVVTTTVTQGTVTYVIKFVIAWSPTSSYTFHWANKNDTVSSATDTDTYGRVSGTVSGTTNYGGPSGDVKLTATQVYNVACSYSWTGTDSATGLSASGGGSGCGGGITTDTRDYADPTPHPVQQAVTIPGAGG